jgi:SLT domain-containing protein
MKSEIESIGKAISKGISEGFTEDSINELRRDLSYIFHTASNAMSGVNSLLDNVFGYATGTQSAQAGLAVVGEAGPELVKFNGGEQVLNTRNTQKALAGAGGNTNNWSITFNNIKDTSAYAMMSQLKAYNRQMAINGII